MRSGAVDPASLLRLTGWIEPYPAEASDEEVAAAVGLPVERVVRFDMNTLGGGVLPGVASALAAYDPGRLVEYGDQAYHRLRRALAGATGAPPHRIVPGAGADELIRLVTTMTVGPGDRALVPVPTFPMYAVEARLAGAEAVEVPRRQPAERQPVARLREAAEANGAGLVWLCSPNNPTGDAYRADEVRQLANGLPAVVVVDAVYQEFAEASAGLGPEAGGLLALQDELPNLLILRSLAKAYGLAGARVGYLIVPEGLARRFDAARLPLSIGGASEAAALGALADPAVARARHREIVAERERLGGKLRARGWEVLPSTANFLLVRPPRAERLAAALQARGLVVRSFPTELLADWLRITVRSPAEDDLLLAAIGSEEV